MAKVIDGRKFALEQSKHYQRCADNLKIFISDLVLLGNQTGSDEESWKYLMRLRKLFHDHIDRSTWWYNNAKLMDREI